VPVVRTPAGNVSVWAELAVVGAFVTTTVICEAVTVTAEVTTEVEQALAQVSVMPIAAAELRRAK